MGNKKSMQCNVNLIRFYEWPKVEIGASAHTFTFNREKCDKLGGNSDKTILQFCSKSNAKAQRAISEPEHISGHCSSFSPNSLNQTILNKNQNTTTVCFVHVACTHSFNL